MPYLRPETNQSLKTLAPMATTAKAKKKPQQPPAADFYHVRTKISRAAEERLTDEQRRRKRATGIKVPLMDIAQELLEAALMALPAE